LFVTPSYPGRYFGGVRPPVGVAYVEHWASVALYVLVAVMWWVPDRRFERVVHDD